MVEEAAVMGDLKPKSTDEKPTGSKPIEGVGTAIAALVAGRPDDQPVVMVNLLKFREEGGAQRYLEYGREVAPNLRRVGAKILYAGSAPSVVIGDEERPWWDGIIIVEYPSATAFADMVSSEEYARVHTHRAEALERGDLIATSWSPMET
jgi:uncharacterized protein (DUF1330 family)